MRRTPERRQDHPHHRRRLRRYGIRHRRAQDYARARPERLRPGEEVRSAHRQRHEQGRFDERERGIVRRIGSIRMPREAVERHGGGRAGHQGRTSHPARAPFPTRRRGDRTARIESMVRKDGRHGGQGIKGRRGREHSDRTPTLRKDLEQLAHRHSRLVRIQTAVVGASHTRMVRGRIRERIRRGAQRRRGAGEGVGDGRTGRCRIESGGGRVGYVVQFGPVAVRHHRMARGRGHRGADRLQSILSGDVPRDGVRHSLLLGGPHGHDGIGIDGKGAVRRGISARTRARERRHENVQDEGERDRSSRYRGRVWGRQFEIFARHGRHPRSGHSAQHGKTRGEP
mmetsp:Transcript_23636/g.69944  ORF Transcript_23636/g.69944 Transcript_23636/m.69944 type:complete len:341 (+) Transcript_23636:1149-2171(+)